jgi:hypothetical protein
MPEQDERRLPLLSLGEQGVGIGGYDGATRAFGRRALDERTGCPLIQPRSGWFRAAMLVRAPQPQAQRLLVCSWRSFGPVVAMSGIAYYRIQPRYLCASPDYGQAAYVRTWRSLAARAVYVAGLRRGLPETDEVGIPGSFASSASLAYPAEPAANRAVGSKPC